MSLPGAPEARAVQLLPLYTDVCNAMQFVLRAWLSLRIQIVCNAMHAGIKIVTRHPTRGHRDTAQAPPGMSRRKRFSGLETRAGFQYGRVGVGGSAQLRGGLARAFP